MIRKTPALKRWTSPGPASRGRSARVRTSTTAAAKPTSPAQATTEGPGVTAKRALPAAMRPPATRKGQRRPTSRGMQRTSSGAGSWQMLIAASAASLIAARPVA